MTKLIHMTSGEPYDVYIGRGTKWGNPFVRGKDGTRQQVIDKYRSWILEQKELMDDLEELEGKALCCWCTPLPCHGDVLIELLEKRKNLERF